MTADQVEQAYARLVNIKQRGRLVADAGTFNTDVTPEDTLLRKVSNDETAFLFMLADEYIKLLYVDRGIIEAAVNGYFPPQ